MKLQKKMPLESILFYIFFCGFILLFLSFVLFVILYFLLPKLALLITTIFLVAVSTFCSTALFLNFRSLQITIENQSILYTFKPWSSYLTGAPNAHKCIPFAEITGIKINTLEMGIAQVVVHSASEHIQLDCNELEFTPVLEQISSCNDTFSLLKNGELTFPPQLEETYLYLQQPTDPTELDISFVHLGELKISTNQLPIATITYDLTYPYRSEFKLTCEGDTVPLLKTSIVLKGSVSTFKPGHYKKTFSIITSQGITVAVVEITYTDFKTNVLYKIQIGNSISICEANELLHTNSNFFDRESLLVLKKNVVFSQETQIFSNSGRIPILVGYILCLIHAVQVTGDNEN